MIVTPYQYRLDPAVKPQDNGMDPATYLKASNEPE